MASPSREKGYDSAIGVNFQASINKEMSLKVVMASARSFRWSSAVRCFL
ncbi:hypothetical protein CES85_5241 [Ochrobactrum quorumnocens]|uniref:Uncharacterized protein n=1 Tax=Ochrobactrum quorumnocens TaxID=271865 RepID=A0A248UCA8_9HYPH|nr:hypothetical protein CES85_5241 [[Ochrobactrum] quorumnocens]